MAFLSMQGLGMFAENSGYRLLKVNNAAYK